MSLVRAAKLEDLPHVWELIQALASYEKLSHIVTGSLVELRKWLFDQPAAECLVCEIEQGIVGYAIFFTTFSTFGVLPGIWLEDVFVLPEFRERGFGKQLIEAVIGIGRERGYGRVEWSVLDWNEPAIGFYRALGADVLPDWRICRIKLAPGTLSP